MNPEILAELINEILIKSTLLGGSDKSFIEGLTPRQVHIVMEIGTQVFRNGDLAGRLGVEPSTLTRTLDPLVKNGLVDRSLNPENRREVLIRLSEKGRTVLQQSHRKMVENCAQILEHVPGQQMEQMEASIRLLLGIMKQIHFKHH
ncbi:MarR family winged helix-turn-helix transcriptional regulator [Paenibacillus hamazuiensis]|uniref:MarR family winged helix-turn-helix transcriptional regulator n=1 Tax=Paenibacillus hamazuiensis TaxID=2936508 RepID=UPI0020102DCE|nr:MarR family transcriptional regulator [Paenibacillus hamazuiensis]